MENSQTGFRLATAIVGAASLLSLSAVKLAAFSDARTVRLFGYETHLGCWFKDNFGVPCPVCGMTRSVILALQGNLQESFALHAGGAPLVFGVLLFGLAMLFFSLPAKFNKISAGEGAAERKVFLTSAIYFLIVAIFSFVYWILRLSGYFPTLPELA